MNIEKLYNAPRRQLGRQLQFNLTQPTMLDSIAPNPAEQRAYILRNPVNQASQACLTQSEHEINTIMVKMKNSSLNHVEGGWPKEVNWNNEEETLRHRRRIEREDHYVRSIMSAAPKFRKFVRQNNAINIYQQYFSDMEEIVTYGKAAGKLNNVYRDPDKRPVAGLSWTIEEDSKLAVSYCSKIYPVSGRVNSNASCFLWELDNPHNPAAEFTPPVACWDLACSPVSPSIIVGGLEDGRVCIFDLRAEAETVTLSPPHTAHRDPVTAILYLQTRHNNEFFTGSSDGQCKWHDIRNLSEPIDNLFMSVNIPRGNVASCANAEGISSLQFDRALPTRFLAGTETGLILNVNRKGKTHQDIMSGVYKAHAGPVRAVRRSPCTGKMLLSCGDWSVHIWSEDIKTSPIMTGMTLRHQIMDAVWAPERLSGLMTVSMDGNFRYWDMLRRMHRPVVRMRLSRYPLLKIVPHEDGRLVTVGGVKGTVFLISLSNNLVTSEPNEKQQMLQMYERESRREQILTTRLKEIRLKLRSAEEAVVTNEEEEPDMDALLVTAEEEYRRIVIDEIRRSGVSHISSECMRKR